ncbi:Uncharacterised protein [Shigella sonnei]|nr:Uncharacterised protein [Shigella sonnei]
MRARQSTDGVNQRSFSGTGDAKDSSDAIGGQCFINGQAMVAQRLGKIQLQHD